MKSHDAARLLARISAYFGLSVSAFLLFTNVVTVSAQAQTYAMEYMGSQVAAVAASAPGYSSCGVLLPADMNHETGNSYQYLYFVENGATNEGALSNVMLFENGTKLGPANSIHANIRTSGAGRFSHWYTGLYFSSSDNTSPITNGRTYSYGVPAGTSCPVRIVKISKVADSAPKYATFQSNGQRVVTNKYGTFAAYHRSEQTSSAPAVYGTPQQWVLARSSDGGKTYSTLYSSQFLYSKAPDIETDEDGNVYLFTVDFGPTGSSTTAGNMILYKFSPSNNFTQPAAVRQYPGEAAGKYTTMYDQGRGLFYYLGFLNTPFLAVDKNGAVARQFQLFSAPNVAGKGVVQYPHMSMDGSRLYVAWTASDAVSGKYNGIHIIYSDDAGASWYAPGSAAQLSLPIVPDDTGPAPEIVPSKFASHSTWLSSVSVLNGITHFMYSLGFDGREQYHNYTASPWAQRTYLDGFWGGERINIQSFDGFFSKAGTSTLYAVGADFAHKDAQGRRRIVVLKSTDNGLVWAPYAYSANYYNAYSISGPRVITDGRVKGLFTDYDGTGDVLNGYTVYSINTPADETLQPPPPAFPKPTCAISFAPTSAASNQRVTYSWSSTNASSIVGDVYTRDGVSLGYGVNELPLSGAVTIYENIPGTYVSGMTAVGPGGTTTCSATFSVVASAAKPVISSFTASPSTITPGQSSVLKWATDFASSFSIDQGVGAATGTSKSVAPTATTTYTLSAGNSFGTTTAIVTVNVKPAYATCGTMAKSAMAKDATGNYAYLVFYFASGGDSNQAPFSSPVMLFENGKALGPAHSQYLDVRDKGQGRFSHWNTFVHFSTSDNSNPITNGRTYTWGVPTGTSCPSAVAAPAPTYTTCGTLNKATAYRESGNAYQLPFVSGGATNEGVLSNVVLFENGTKLGPANSIHADIRNSGAGRFSHWYNYLYFSSTDNTSPLTNGRTYTWGVPTGQSCPA